MNTLTGIIAYNERGKSFIFDRTAVSQFNLELSDVVWDIGIDAASKYTGISLMDTNEKAVILLDVKRDPKVPKEKYFDDLYYLLKRLVKGKCINLTVNEKPFTGGYVRASDVLIALRGKIEDWVKEIPELAESKYRLIYPQTWKSQIIDKTKGKSRFNAKGAIAEDLCDIFPLLAEYKTSLSSGDLDSFDALGALLGYKRSSMTADGTEKINGMKEKSHVSLVAYDWVPVSAVTESYIDTKFNGFSAVFKPKYLEYNAKYSLLDNIVMASSNNDCVFTLVPENNLQQFQWKLGIDITEPSKVLIMFIFRKGNFSIKEIEMVKKCFDWTEEVQPG